MNLVTAIILLVIAALLGLALYFIFRKKGSDCGSSGGCAGCTGCSVASNNKK